MSSSLLLVGHGKMGGALLTRWRESRPAGITEFIAVDAHRTADAPPHITTLDALSPAFRPAVIVFAVKPQSLAAILPQYRERFGQDPLYLSVAAGKALSFYTAHLGEAARVVRAMPNTPALIGQGITALCTSPALPEKDRHMATALMEATGQATWVAEAQMDAVTALSGCGPAYVFLFLDSLVKASIANGLDEATAHTLALATLSGSGALATQATESLGQLIKNVASPGGSTQAALDVLMKHDALASLMAEALTAATRRSKELSE